MLTKAQLIALVVTGVITTTVLGIVFDLPTRMIVLW